MLKRWMCWAAAWLVCMPVGLLSANAHDLPLDRMMNGFVKIEPRQTDFVVRGKSTLTSGSTLDCSINPQKKAQCVPAKSSQYAVCSTNGKIVHLMSTQNPCQ
jgi:hypothetical protein